MRIRRIRRSRRSRRTRLSHIQTSVPRGTLNSLYFPRVIPLWFQFSQCIFVRIWNFYHKTINILQPSLLLLFWNSSFWHGHFIFSTLCFSKIFKVTVLSLSDIIFPRFPCGVGTLLLQGSHQLLITELKVFSRSMIIVLNDILYVSYSLLSICYRSLFLPQNSSSEITKNLNKI